MERTQQKTRRHLEEKTLRVAVRPGDWVFGGVQSAEAAIPKPGTTLHPKELGMGKLKKKQLGDSNSKIQNCIPMEHLVSCSKLPKNLVFHPLPSQTKILVTTCLQRCCACKLPVLWSREDLDSAASADIGLSAPGLRST